MSTLEDVQSPGPNCESTVYTIGTSWHGFSAIKHLVIFGASYCDVGYRSPIRPQPHPTPQQPLGIDFPGETYTEPGTPNWVGHLVTEYTLHEKVLAYCYATGGARVEGVTHQIQQYFEHDIARKPDWAPWCATDTLFITWVGINDCAWGGSVTAKMELLKNSHKHLFDLGARNFLFINVPPVHRSPGMLQTPTTGSNRGHIYNHWNENLAETVRQFTNEHPEEITAMIYSSYDTFTRVLDDPISHGFTFEDVGKEEGGIWYDHLHPTSAMHEIIAKDIATFLGDRPAFHFEERPVICGRCI